LKWLKKHNIQSGNKNKNPEGLVKSWLSGLFITFFFAAFYGTNDANCLSGSKKRHSKAEVGKFLCKSKYNL
jgi:hypothetical protein